MLVLRMLTWLQSQQQIVHVLCSKVRSNNLQHVWCSRHGVVHTVDISGADTLRAVQNYPC